MAATASPSKDGNDKHEGYRGSDDKNSTWVDPTLTGKAKDQPNAKIRVILQSNFSARDARSKAKSLGSFAKVGKDLDLVGGVALELPARLIEKLAKVPGLTITPDASVKVSGNAYGLSSSQLWPHENGSSALWNVNTALPAIAIVDSGIEANRPDFDNGARVVAEVNLSKLPGNSSGDGRGHGTFVAGIAAGSARGKAGAAPKANIVSIDVMDDNGMALTSDVIAAAGWILENKAKYNIKVANFSLHSTYPSNFGRDPLDFAVEKLWFAGVTVVAAAGNYGNADGTASGVRYAPGNDPFIITVGAVDLGGSAKIKDDSVAHWSAWGYTYDGFRKPDMGAAGRYMVGPVPVTSTLPLLRPEKVVSPGYMELSGTSFAAPVVAGAAAYLMGKNPTWGPDQVKGALMKAARAVPQAAPGAAGVGQINVVGAYAVKNPPNPNKGLNQFLVTDAAGQVTFDAVSWYDVAKADVSWDSVSWADVSWGDVSWDSVSWADVSWSDVSWADVSWSDVSWADVSWADTSKEDAVMEEPGPGTGIELEVEHAAELLSDPDLQVDPALVDHELLELLAPATVTTTSTTAPVTTSAVAVVTTTL